MGLRMPHRLASAVLACTLLRAAAANVQPLRPLTVDFASLVRGGTPDVAEALAADGVLAVKVPGLASLRKTALRHASACIEKSPEARSVTMQDGTVRKTLAGEAKPVREGFAVRELGPIAHGTGASDSPSCASFDKVGAKFRQLVGNVADAFGKRLAESTGLATPGYADFSSAVQAGLRLEHFHLYTAGGAEHFDVDEPPQTLDFHVDQGLFIVFAPAEMVHAPNPRSVGLTTGSFQIRVRSDDNGADAVRELAIPDEDCLVVLLGDAVQQISAKSSVALHAPAHAFRMLPLPGSKRAWYGLMQLPPNDFVNEESGLTYGEIRARRILNADNDSESSDSSLGCFTRRLTAVSDLDGHGCNTSSQVYCWHRCMNFTETANPDYCRAEGNMGFQCVSQFDQIYVEGHGDYFPSCTNSTETVTPRPPVVQPVQPSQSALDAEIALDDSLTDASAYHHRVALAENETYFLWRDLQFTSGTLAGKLVHSGRAGWLSIGMEKVGGYHNGMNGARVIMGLNDPDGNLPAVAEYKIHEQNSAFRHWITPSYSYLQAQGGSGNFEVRDNVSMLEFETAGVFDWEWNLTSGETSNKLIWGLSHLAFCTADFGGYAPYHSATDGARDQRHRFRGKLEIDFATGEVVLEDDATSTAESDETSLACRFFAPLMQLPLVIAGIAASTALIP